MSVTLVDSLPEIGGQVSALYPEKAILDVAGFPNVKGRELVEQLVEQAAQREADVPPGPHRDRAQDRRRRASPWASTTAPRCAPRSSSSPPASASSPPRPLPAGDGWEDRGLVFFVPSFAEYAGKDVVIVGGGDSAFDWAHSLEPIANSVTLVHRRDKFRAHQATVDAVLAGSTEVITKAQVTALIGDAPRRERRDHHERRRGARRGPPRPWSRRSASSPT